MMKTRDREGEKGRGSEKSRVRESEKGRVRARGSEKRRARGTCSSSYAPDSDKRRDVFVLHVGLRIRPPSPARLRISKRESGRTPGLKSSPARLLKRPEETVFLLRMCSLSRLALAS
jgi:hypothetical protein